MEITKLISIESVSWLLVAFGWLAQMYQGYAKRSTRISKRGLTLMLLGMLGIVISSWMTGFSVVVGLQLAVLLFIWLAYVRRR